MTALEKEFARIQALPLHHFTKRCLKNAAARRAGSEYTDLSIHPRNWYLRRPDLYKRGEKSNTAKPRKRLLRAA